MAVLFTKRGTPPTLAPPIGTTWLFEQNGEFEVPATGQYEVEIHGGGSSCKWIVSAGVGITGNGSGELHELTLNKKDKYSIVIGAGANDQWYNQYGKAPDGGTTSFGQYSVSGGIGGSITYFSNVSLGSSSGSLATSGVQFYGTPNVNNKGGLGNKNKPNQNYGNGAFFDTDETYNSGSNGAVIITYLGK